MSKILVKRSDPIYIEIENFKDYELTNNIAYEMAIRNVTVGALRFGLDTMFLQEKRERKYNPEFFKDDEIHMSIRELEIRYKLRNEFYITWLHDDFDEEYSKHYHFSDIRGFELNFDENGKYKNMTIKAGDVSTAAELIPTFSRPIMLPMYDKDKRLPHFINLGLPLKELHSYIAEIKKKFDKNHKYIATLAELLGDEADAANDKVQVKARKHRAKSVLSYKKKVADMFFVYDADRHDMGIQQIRSEINSYHESQGAYRSLVDNIRYKYLDVAKEYIDNLKYKELVSGISW